MSRSTWVLAGVAGGSLLGAVGVAWLSWPPPVDAERLTPERPQRAVAAAEPRERPAAAERRPERRPRPEEPEPEPEYKLPPDERAEARQQFREELKTDVNLRLEAYAEDAGWDEALTEQVRVILQRNADRIGESLARIDRGESTWEDEREGMRAARVAQVESMRELLGEEFEDFAVAMEFVRFLEPPPGR